VALLYRYLGHGARLERSEVFGALPIERDFDDRTQAGAELLSRQQRVTPLSSSLLTRRRQVAAEVWAAAASAWLVNEASRWSCSRIRKSVASNSIASVDSIKNLRFVN
jgi:hypothetical protein